MNMVVKSDAPPTRELVISCLTGEFRAVAESLPPELVEMSIEELQAIRKPTEVDYFMKKNLWKQAELAQKGAISTITAASVFKGVCTETNFLTRVIKNQARIAWLLSPPQEDLDRATFGFQVGLTNLIKFVSKEPTAETAGAFLKAMEMLWNRVHGPVAQIQKIDKRSAHVNLNKPMAPSPVEGAGSRLEELKSKILESTRDVTPNEASDDEGETGTNPS